MRHRNRINHLSRTSTHRKAMLANMATSLILHKRISTTVAKAKELRKYVEPLINKSKEDSTSSRRYVFSYLQSKTAVTELFREISSKIAGRPGGYTRILKTGARLGDNAEMCFIELVDYNQTYKVSEKGTAHEAKPTRRGRRTRKTGDEQGEKAQKSAPVLKEAVKEAKPVEPVKADVVEEPIAEEPGDIQPTGDTPDEQKKD